MTTEATQQFQALKDQLLEAYVQRDQADEKIKAIRNMIAGIGLGQQLATPDPAPPVPADP